VINQQREIIYKQRTEVLERDNLRPVVEGMLQSVVERIVAQYTPDSEVPEDWDYKAIADYANSTFFHEDTVTVDEIKMKQPEEIVRLMMDKIKAIYDQRESEVGAELMREFEKVVVLRAVDTKWMDHIDAMDQLRQGIHLRAYGQTDPLRAYQMEGYEMFQSMIESIEEEVATYILKATIHANIERKAVAVGKSVRPDLASPGAASSPSGSEEQPKRQPVRVGPKIGRNDPCPCGSGKKYKHCCGA
jgi:preprotein translocase subunit SecA